MISSPNPAASAYDQIATEYDGQLEQNPVALYMRRALHADFARLFKRGDRVLDFTAGTGLDALYLASLGVRVTAFDASSGMIAELRRAASRAGVTVEAEALPAERLSDARLRDLDGAISTFGGLNTIDDPQRLAWDLHSSLRPGGRLILHALNQFCFWQWVRGRSPSRRTVQRVSLGDRSVRHHFYNPFELWRTAFYHHFDLISVASLSVVAAPPLIRRFPALASSLFAADRIAGRVFPAAGDFFVTEMVRRDE